MPSHPVMSACQYLAYTHTPPPNALMSFLIAPNEHNYITLVISVPKTSLDYPFNKLSQIKYLINMPQLT